MIPMEQVLVSVLVGSKEKTMTIKRSLAIRWTCASALPLCLAIAASAQHTTSTNVTTIVHDYSSDGTQLLMRSDDYNGSGQATYTYTNSGSLRSSHPNGDEVLR